MICVCECHECCGPGQEHMCVNRFKHCRGLMRTAAVRAIASQPPTRTRKAPRRGEMPPRAAAVPPKSISPSVTAITSPLHARKAPSTVASELATRCQSHDSGSHTSCVVARRRTVGLVPPRHQHKHVQLRHLRHNDSKRKQLLYEQV